MTHIGTCIDMSIRLYLANSPPHEIVFRYYRRDIGEGILPFKIGNLYFKASLSQLPCHSAWGPMTVVNQVSFFAIVLL